MLNVVKGHLFKIGWSGFFVNQGLGLGESGRRMSVFC